MIKMKEICNFQYVRISEIFKISDDYQNSENFEVKNSEHSPIFQIGSFKNLRIC